MKPGRLFLVGFMGSGKSVVAGLLARRLGCEHADTDRLVEARAGVPVARLWQEVGEAGFRQLEWDVLVALGPETPPIVAAGGGLVSDRRARHWMRDAGTSVWLDVALPVLRERVGNGAGRPLWNGGDRALYERRRALYALADLRVEAGVGPPEIVAERVLARLGPSFFH